MQFTTGDVYEALIERQGDDAHPPGRPTISRNLKSLAAANIIESDRQGNHRRLKSVFWKLMLDFETELEGRFAPRPMPSVEDAQ